MEFEMMEWASEQVEYLGNAFGDPLNDCFGIAAVLNVDGELRHGYLVSELFVFAARDGKAVLPKPGSKVEILAETFTRHMCGPKYAVGRRTPPETANGRSREQIVQ